MSGGMFEALRARVAGRQEGLRKALAIVEAFRGAYPIEVFPWDGDGAPPSTDAVAARMGRHVCDQLTKQLHAAIDAEEEADHG